MCRDSKSMGIGSWLQNISHLCQGPEKIRDGQFQVKRILSFNLEMEKITHNDQNMTWLQTTRALLGRCVCSYGCDLIPAGQILKMTMTSPFYMLYIPQWGPYGDIYRKETKVKAMAPIITWSDLVISLFPISFPSQFLGVDPWASAALLLHKAPGR